MRQSPLGFKKSIFQGFPFHVNQSSNWIHGWIPTCMGITSLHEMAEGAVGVLGANQNLDQINSVEHFTLSKLFLDKRSSYLHLVIFFPLATTIWEGLKGRKGFTVIVFHMESAQKLIQRQRKSQCWETKGIASLEELIPKHGKAWIGRDVQDHLVPAMGRTPSTCHG